MVIGTRTYNTYDEIIDAIKNLPNSADMDMEITWPDGRIEKGYNPNIKENLLEGWIQKRFDDYNKIKRNNQERIDKFKITLEKHKKKKKSEIS